MVEDGVDGDGVAGSNLPQVLERNHRPNFVVLATGTRVLSTGQGVHVPEIEQSTLYL